MANFISTSTSLNPLNQVIYWSKHKCALYYSVLYTVLHYTLHCTTLHPALQFTILCTVLHYTLYCFTLYSALYYPILSKVLSSTSHCTSHICLNIYYTALHFRLHCFAHCSEINCFVHMKILLTKLDIPLTKYHVPILLTKMNSTGQYIISCEDRFFIKGSPAKKQNQLLK